MAKFKPVRQKPKPGPQPGAVPCVILVIAGMVLLSLLFWAVLSSGIK
ncbi:MAG: hypothetical protein HY235_26025 [Acidobacteria bacterium]|nr:hypothetical protein [Acidobacteriota bacterium]